MEAPTVCDLQDTDSKSCYFTKHHFGPASKSELHPQTSTSTAKTLGQRWANTCGLMNHLIQMEIKDLTIDELSLLLDDLLTQVSVLLEALHHKVLLPDDAVLQQRVRLNLRVLDLQLVDLAEESQDLPLAVGAHPLEEQLLLAPGLIPQLQEPALQQHLEDERWDEGRSFTSESRPAARTFCLWSFFCSAVSVSRFSRASLTSWDSVLSGGVSGESESFSLSSFFRLSFFLSACHFLLCWLCSCSQLGQKHIHTFCCHSLADPDAGLILFYRHISSLCPFF